MHERKPIKIPILAGEKLFIDQCLKTQEEVEYISRVPYASAIGNSIYVMVYARSYISYVVGVLRRCMCKLGKEYWRK